jgi:hypothetical protein
MEQSIQFSGAKKNSEVTSGGTKPWRNKDMSDHSDLAWDAERDVKLMTWQLNFALRAIEEREVNLLKWQFELLLNAIDVDETGA